MWLTLWGRVTHICVGNKTIIDSDNGLSPGRRHATIWTNAGLSLIRPLGTNFREILIGNQTFSFKKMHLKIPSSKWLPFCLGVNVQKLTWGIYFPTFSGNPCVASKIYHRSQRLLISSSHVTIHGMISSLKHSLTAVIYGRETHL